MKLLSRAGNLMDYIGVQTEEVQEKMIDISTSLKKLKVVVDQWFGVELLNFTSSNTLKEKAMVQKVYGKLSS